MSPTLQGTPSGEVGEATAGQLGRVGVAKLSIQESAAVFSAYASKKPRRTCSVVEPESGRHLETLLH